MPHNNIYNKMKDTNDNKPIGICNRTKTYVYPTTVKGYAGYCPELDEDLFTFEFTKFNFKINKTK